MCILDNLAGMSIPHEDPCGYTRREQSYPPEEYTLYVFYSGHNKLVGRLGRDFGLSRVMMNTQNEIERYSIQHGPKELEPRIEVISTIACGSYSASFISKWS